MSSQPAPNTAFLYDVFLSHSSSDKPLVEALAARLEDDAKLRPFLDKWHLVPGQPWQEELEKAIQQSATCAVFLGPSGLGPWENEEMRTMLSRRVSNKQLRVIPVLLPNANPKDENTLPIFLQRYTWVDFRGGLDDKEAFRRLVAGIQGKAPGRTDEISPPPSMSIGQRLKVFFSYGLSSNGQGIEFRKILIGAIIALLLSSSFIAAAIPNYDLQIKSPAFKKDGVYEVTTGTVIIKWALIKSQWFRKTDISGSKANVVVKKFGEEHETPFTNAPGELKTNLAPGKYEVRIDATEYQRTETIALQVTPPNAGDGTMTTYLRGVITDNAKNAVDGAEVEVKEILGQPIIKTTTTNDGGFNLSNIPARFGDRARVIVRVKGVEKYNQYHTLPGPVTIQLEK